MSDGELTPEELSRIAAVRRRGGAMPSAAMLAGRAVLILADRPRNLLGTAIVFTRAAQAIEARRQAVEALEQLDALLSRLA